MYLLAELEVEKEKYIRKAGPDLKNMNNNQVEKYHQEFLDIITFLDKTDGLLINKKMDVGLFKNIISVAVFVKKYEWAKQFISRYQSKLFAPNVVDPGPIIKMNKAIVTFGEGKYNQSFEELESLDHAFEGAEDIFYKIIYNKLLLMLYFQ